MAVDLSLYAKIKDKYCLVYLGSSEEYLVQLKLLKPLLESQYPGIEITLCSRDEWADDEILKYSELSNQRNMFAYVREITYKDNKHPIEQLLSECQISNYTINTPVKKTNNFFCKIFPHANYPTKPLTSDQIKKIQGFVTSKGYKIVQNCDPAEIGWAIGVENKDIFIAASTGIKTTLVATGVGTNLFKTMFSAGEILHLKHI